MLVKSEIKLKFIFLVLNFVYFLMVDHVDCFFVVVFKCLMIINF